MFGRITSSIGSFLKSKSSAYFGMTRGGIILGPIETEEAQQVTVFNNCVLLMCDLISSLEWSAPKNKRIQRLLDKPNPWQPTGDFFYSITYDLLTEGVAYIDRQEVGEFKYAAPLSPEEVILEVVDGVRKYRITPVDGSAPYEAEDDTIIQILDIPTSRIDHTSRKDLCKEALRKIISIDRYVRDLCDNGPVIGMQLNSPDEIENPEELEREFNKKFGKTTHAQDGEQLTGKSRGGLGIFGGGAQLNTVGPTLEFSPQMLQAYRREEYKVCGVFKAPPFLVGVSEGDTKYSNFNAQQSGLYRDGVEPIVSRIAAALSAAYKTEIVANLDKFIAGDLATASEVAGKNYERGGWTKNEFRQLTGKPPVAGGDDFREPKDLIRPDEGMDPNRPRSGPDDDIDPGNLTNTPDED